MLESVRVPFAIGELAILTVCASTVAGQSGRTQAQKLDSIAAWGVLGSHKLLEDQAS